MPKTLMRLPYEDRPDPSIAREQQRTGTSQSRLNEFCFREDIRGPDTRKYLWGGAAYAFAGVVIRSFCRTNWLTDIRGVQRNDDGGGLVTDLPIQFSKTDAHGIAPKISTDVIVTDENEKELTDLGFIPLCSCYDTGYSAFYSAKSIQIPKKYDDELANMNSRVSSMMYTMLCASRFAHYLKKLGRDMVGRLGDAEDIEQELQNWITNYVTADTSASTNIKARYPLASANITVKPVPGKSGVYRSIFHLQPHYEIEGLSAGIRLVTEL
jgi:type VI secretion system ImpC/EvpB family protein